MDQPTGSSTKSDDLLVASAVLWIVRGLDLREPLHASGVDLRDPMFEPGALQLVFYFAIAQSAFKSYELSLLESLGELREIAPGIDTVHSVRVW